MYLFLKFSEGAGSMPLEPTRLGHLLFYKFSPHVHTTLKSLAMPLVRSAHFPLIPPPPNPVFLVYNLTRSVPSYRHALRSEHLGQATQRSKEWFL